MFKYQVDFWDEFNKISTTEQGLTSAISYGEAAEKITDFYGKDNIYSIYIEAWGNILTKDDILEGFKTVERNSQRHIDTKLEVSPTFIV